VSASKAGVYGCDIYDSDCVFVPSRTCLRTDAYGGHRAADDTWRRPALLLLGRNCHSERNAMDENVYLRNTSDSVLFHWLLAHALLIGTIPVCMYVCMCVCMYEFRNVLRYVLHSAHCYTHGVDNTARSRLSVDRSVTDPSPTLEVSADASFFSLARIAIRRLSSGFGGRGGIADPRILVYRDPDRRWWDPGVCSRRPSDWR